MHDELAECGQLSERLAQMGAQLDRYLEFEYPDAMHRAASWRTALGGELPQRGIGMDALVEQMGRHLIPNASQIPKPGCTSFITTGASSAGTLATLCGAVASPQRIGLTAFNFLEEVSLRWLAEMFELPRAMAGLYSSGGSVANLVALGAAIHVQVDGENTHHMVEAVFKGAGRAFRPALERSKGDVPSTKGIL